MRSLTAVGVILSAVAIAPTAQAAQIRLDFDAFIPSARVTNPVADTLPPFFTEFIGDDRGFSLEATRNGQSRLFSQVILDTDMPNPLVSSFTEAGTSVGFLQQDGIETSQSLQDTPTSSVEATRIDEQTILLEIEAQAVNPLIEAFIPPEIEVEVPPAEYVYDIELTLLDGAIDYALSGTTKAYPNYSAFLNGVPILQNEIDSDDSNLLCVIEPVSASGTVAVNEPANLLGLCLVSAAIAFGSKANRRKTEQ